MAMKARTGQQSQTCITIAVGIGLFLTGVAGVPAPAAAGSTELKGVTVTWDDTAMVGAATSLSAPFPCGSATFTWQNKTSADLIYLAIRLTSSTGRYTLLVNESMIPPGASGIVRTPLCPLQGWTGTAELRISTIPYPSPPVDPPPRYEQTVPITLLSRDETPVQKLSTPCPSELPSTPAFCSNTNLLVFDSMGQSGTQVVLVGKNGRVPIRDESAYWADTLGTTSTAFVRPNLKRFPPGRYAVASWVTTSGKWSCSIHYQDVCKWQGAQTSQRIYRFTWTGVLVTNVQAA